MSLDNLKDVEASLWEAADQLRANSKLNSSEYSMPVLGLIFLRHASNRFTAVAEEIEATLPKRGGKSRAITKEDFTGRAALFLPEKARYDYLAGLPSEEDLGATINEAMRLIEAEDPEQLAGVLPKDFHRFDKKVLEDLVRIFDREALRNATGDVFGRIYEYFLNKFASSVASDEGQFFTPPSLVRLIVNVIEPNHGKVFDPAVGSAGMLVQSAHFIEAVEQNPGEVATFLGRDKSELTVKLAKMNVVVHGFNADIREGNTYYDREAELVGKCDFVMANPPFNVDGVDPARVKDDPRLWTKKKIPGITKGSPAKKNGKAGQKPPGVSNANYLWIQYFYSYLNGQGRAGFVMAASATDAGHGEQEIRKEIVETGDVDVIIRIGEKFFYTRGLPCTLWFFDRGKPKERRDKVLMLDARSIHRVLSRRIHDFSEEQLKNLTAIVWLYRGETDRYLGLVREYLEQVQAAIGEMPAAAEGLDQQLKKLGKLLATVKSHAETCNDVEAATLETFSTLLDERSAAIKAFEEDRKADYKALAAWSRLSGSNGARLTTNVKQRKAYDSLAETLPRLRALQKHISEAYKLTVRALDVAENELGARAMSGWNARDVRAWRSLLDEGRQNSTSAIKSVANAASQVHLLQTRFPDATYNDCTGICKIVSRAQIAAQDWSLTPGRYVGVAPAIQDEEDFEERLRAIHLELNELHEEAGELHRGLAAELEELL